MPLTIKLPPAFYNDHVSRDLPSGTVLKETKSYVLVELDDVAFADLLSDAEYYDSERQAFGFEFAGLCRSAAATAKRLRAAIDEHGLTVADCSVCGGAGWTDSALINRLGTPAAGDSSCEACRGYGREVRRNG